MLLKGLKGHFTKSRYIYFCTKKWGKWTFQEHPSAVETTQWTEFCWSSWENVTRLIWFPSPGQQRRAQQFDWLGSPLVGWWDKYPLFNSRQHTSRSPYFPLFNSHNTPPATSQRGIIYTIMYSTLFPSLGLKYQLGTATDTGHTLS